MAREGWKWEQQIKEYGLLFALNCYGTPMISLAFFSQQKLKINELAEKWIKLSNHDSSSIVCFFSPLFPSYFPIIQATQVIDWLID